MLFFSGKGNVWIAFRSNTCQICISDLVAVLPLWLLPRGLLFLLLLLLFHQLLQFPPPQDDRSFNGHLRVIEILKVSSLIGVKCEKCTSLCLQLKLYKGNQWAGTRSVMATTPESWLACRNSGIKSSPPKPNKDKREGKPDKPWGAIWRTQPCSWSPASRLQRCFKGLPPHPRKGPCGDGAGRWAEHPGWRKNKKGNQ